MFLKLQSKVLLDCVKRPLKGLLFCLTYTFSIWVQVGCEMAFPGGSTVKNLPVTLEP